MKKIFDVFKYYWTHQRSEIYQWVMILVMAVHCLLLFTVFRQAVMSIRSMYFDHIGYMVYISIAIAMIVLIAMAEFYEKGREKGPRGKG